MGSDQHAGHDVARRRVVGALARTAALIAAAATGLLQTARAWAGERNVPAFDAKVLDEALAAAGVTDAVESPDVVLRAPDIAENSAIVHIEIESKLPGTRSILLFAEKNPQPFVAQFDILPGMDPFVAVRIKMAESAHLRAVVLTDTGRFFARRETTVTLGGCAG